MAAALAPTAEAGMPGIEATIVEVAHEIANAAGEGGLFISSVNTPVAAFTAGRASACT